MGWLARILVAILLGFSLALPVRADTVAPHLVDLAKSLFAGIGPDDYEATGNPDFAREMETALARSRIRNWKGTAPTVAADPAALAAPLGLDPGAPDHRVLLDELLAARDGRSRDLAFGRIFQQTGLETRKARQAAIEGFDAALARALGELARRATIPLDGGQSLSIEWEPETASVLARLDLGDGWGELVLHGAATGSMEDGRLTFSAEPDAEPVTWISPSMQEAIRQEIDGVWLDDAGSRWLIRGGGAIDSEPAEAQEKARAELAALEAEMARLQGEKVYIWADGKGGEVIQTRFRRLQPPFRYDRERSEAFQREEIAALQQRIDAAAATLPPSLPVDQFDPLKRKQAGAPKGRPIEIQVRQTSGWNFTYDEASFDGKRVTASRTLRDARDIDDLPDWVIATLVASWSPPEWIELQARLNPRTRSIRLEGKRWRLVVHYNDGFYQSVNAIDSPWSEAVVLRRESDSVELRVVDLDGKLLESVVHDQPFRVEASFTEAQSATQVLLARRQGGDLEIDLGPASDDKGMREFTSGILYIRSADWAGRKEPGSLFLPDRFVDQAELEARRGEWRKLTEESQRLVARQFRGGWAVEHQTGMAGSRTEGTAMIAEDGTAASLILRQSAEQSYRAMEMRAWHAGGEDHLLEIRFEKTDPSTLAEKMKPYPPLPRGQILYYPQPAKEAVFALDEAETSADLALEVAPGDILHVRLNSRDADHLTGTFGHEQPGGEISGSGDASWQRGRPKIRIGQLDLDYSGWHATRMMARRKADEALAEVVAIGKIHQEQLQRVSGLQAEVLRLEAVEGDRRAALLAAIEAKDDVPDELKDLAYRRYEARVARGQARLDQIMERLPLALDKAKGRLVEEYREVESVMAEDLRQMQAREEALGIARHREEARRRADEAEELHWQAVKELAHAVTDRNIVANVISGTLADYHAAVERHAEAQRAASIIGDEAPLITRINAPRFQAEIWHPEEDLKKLERQIAETRATLNDWEQRRRHYRALLLQRGADAERAAASLLRWQQGSIAAQVGVELVFTGSDILLKLQSGGPYAALGEAYKKIAENVIWPPSYLDANNLVPEGHDLLDTLEANAPDTAKALKKRFFKSAGTGPTTSALVATYMRSESAARLQELGQRMIHQSWLDSEEEFLRAVRRNFEVRPLYDAQRANLAKAEAAFAKATDFRKVARSATSSFVIGLVKDYAKHEAKQAIANLFEGEAFQSFNAAQFDLSATSTMLLRCSNYYWQAADLLAGFVAMKREILSQYDPASSMKLAGDGEIDTENDLLIEFSDRGRDPHHPNPIEMEVHLGTEKAERLSAQRLIYRIPAAALQALPEGAQPLRVRITG